MVVEVEGAAVEAAATSGVTSMARADGGSLAEISILKAASKLTPPGR